MWNWAIWGALILSAAGGSGALAYVVVRALQAWRDFKRARRHLLRAVEQLGERAASMGTSVESAADTTRVTESVARLRRSLARLAVLRDAVGEAQATFGRLAAVMPRR